MKHLIYNFFGMFLIFWSENELLIKLIFKKNSKIQETDIFTPPFTHAHYMRSTITKLNTT